MRNRINFAALFLLIAFSAQAQICSMCHDIHGTFVSAFHGRGVAHCNMCHTMHNSEDGALVDPDNPGGNPWLLRKSTPSDVCLTCHAGYVGTVFGEDPLNPSNEIGAGNFIFLLEDNLNDGEDGAANPIPGRAAGHSILAPSVGLFPDGTLAESPGGSFPSSALGCTSCHDPHGNSSFRMLNGAHPIQDGLYAFTSPAPDAEGLSIYHGHESNSRHSAYKAGVSAWCGNCHGDYHANSSQLIHPSGVALGSEIVNRYNLYNGTSDQDGGDQASAYLAAVPFEDSGADYTSSQGPGASSKVMCLTCHRAHASSAPDAGRWDFSVTLLSEDGAESGSYPIPNPYSDLAQRSLCNKCHHKDAYDAP